MAQDVIENWVEKARHAKDMADANGTPKSDGVKVIRREPKTDGEMIMDIADKIWPSLMNLFADVRDENGMLMQPSRVRAIALNVAQYVIKKSKTETA